MPENTKLAIIMRGLPGSGKSYWVRQYLESLELEQTLHIKQYGYFSTDTYFYVDGSYSFNAKRLSEYHQLNLTGFIQAMANGEPTVICDNTNTCNWEYLAYETAAKALGYQVRVVVIGQPKDSEHQRLCAQRNKHNVPYAAIKRMGQAFELN
ncbi:ATP-binding protein [Shewanella maritima]|uniref:ATP-binding protein n=1 Tax=Shewanella maritima TaxID=2520507 RepID=UPI00373526BE